MKWIEKVKCGRKPVVLEEGTERMSNPATDEKTQQAREMVMANGRGVIDELACSVQIWKYNLRIFNGESADNLGLVIQSCLLNVPTFLLLIPSLMLFSFPIVL